MRNRIILFAGALITAAFVAPAFGGTTTIDFAASTGLLTHKSSAGPGELVQAAGRASFTGANVTLLEQDANVISSWGTTSATMTLRPSVDAVNDVGLIMSGIDWEGYPVTLQAVCNGTGDVTLTDWIGNWRTVTFTYPNASNNYFTLQYNASLERATLTLNGASSAFLELAMNGATSVQVGVGANGIGGFSLFAATGPGIPDYPPAAVDSDGDGVTDADETFAGTDPNDPGSLPVSNAAGATIHALNGATVAIEAGSLPASSVNVAVSAPAEIPDGEVPDGKSLSEIGVELEPDGTNFTSPVTVTLPYTMPGIAGLVESSLTVFYFDEPVYSADGIAGVAMDEIEKTVTFTTTHFTTFVIAGDLTDSDGDGIDDWWETQWFGNLITANATSDYDGDGMSDLVEFQNWPLGMNPTVADGPLPVSGVLGTIMLSAAILAFGSRRRS